MINDFKYDESDIISETIISFYNNCDKKEEIQDIVERYVGDKKFFEYVQKNFLVKKISISYLLRIFNDYDDDNVVDDYDYITIVNTTRWI